MNYITGTLEDVTRNVPIPWDTSSRDLIITTDSATGSEDEVVVHLYNENGDLPAGIKINFFSPIKYVIYKCNSWTPFPTTPPEEVKRTWRIRYDQQALTVKIWCNDVKVLDVTLSDAVCSTNSYWRTTWERERTKIKFDHNWDTASDKYCTTPSTIEIGMIYKHGPGPG